MKNRNSLLTSLNSIIMKILNEFLEFLINFILIYFYSSQEHCEGLLHVVLEGLEPFAAHGTVYHSMIATHGYFHYASYSEVITRELWDSRVLFIEDNCLFSFSHSQNARLMLKNVEPVVG